MIKSTIRIFLFITVTSLMPSRAQTLQTWESVSGHSFQGTLIRMDGQNVTLTGTDGREVSVPLNILTPASQELAKKEQELTKANGPAFQHANPYFRYTLQPEKEWIRIQFMERGKPIEGQDHVILLNYSEYIDAKKRQSVDPKELVEPVQQKGNNAIMRVRMENGAVIRVTVSVDQKKELEFEYEIESASQSKSLEEAWVGITMEWPTLLAWDMNSKTFKGPLAPEGVPAEKLPVILEGYQIDVHKYNGEEESVPYHLGRDKGFQGEEVKITRGTNTSLVLTSPADREDGRVETSFYGGKMPAEGYRIRYANWKGETRAGPFSIQVK